VSCGSCCVAKGGLNMTRIISIIMAIIIMLTAGVNTEMITALAKTTTTTSQAQKRKLLPTRIKRKRRKTHA